jgi:hypothetical protein
MTEKTPPAAMPAAAPADGTYVAELRAENARLRAALARAGQPAGQPAVQHKFFLSEGDRQELEMTGSVAIGGKRMTTDQVRAELAKSDTQAGTEVADADPESVLNLPTAPTPGPGIRGVDFVYPSVARGEIDPAVAGTPGVNGPAAKSGK